MLLKASVFKIATLPVTAAALFLSPLSAASASDLSLVGPLESVDCKGATAQILGVRFVAADPKSAKLLCTLGVSSSPRYVVAEGTRDAANSVRLEKLELVSKVYYVAGATTVYIRGQVSEASGSVGTVSISGALVDASFTMPQVGSVIEVAGTQPIRGGVIIPATLNIVSTNSSMGSGVTANSSMGSGIVTNSSMGSGVTTDSSIGSGVEASSVIESGVSANSSMGSGIATNSSMGSGVAVNSSMGTGLSTNSSMGSGVAVNSSMGSGVSKNSSLGSGRTVKSVIGSG